MQLPPIQLNCLSRNNYVNHNYFGNVPSQEKQAKDDNKKVSNKLFIGLGALALAGLVGVLIYKGRNKINSSNSMPNVGNASDTFRNSLSDIDRQRFDEKLKNLKMSKLNLLNYLKDENSLMPIKYHLAAKETELESSLTMPQVFSFNNISEKQKKDIGKILSFILDGELSSTKYTKGYIKEFVQSLQDFSSDSHKKYGEEKVRTFLNFENASEFLEDLNLKENTECKLKFDALIKNNPNNKITYILDSNSAKKLDSNYITELNFDEKVTSADLTSDLDDVEFKLDSKLLPKAQSINKELSEYTQTDPNCIFKLRNLMIDKQNDKIVLIEGENKNNLEKVLSLLSSKTNNVFETIDCKEFSTDILLKLNVKGEKTEELYNRTGKRTFLYLGNLEQVLNSIKDNSLKEFIENCSNKYHIIPVIDKKTSFETNLNENQIFRIRLLANGEKNLQDFLELMYDRMSKNDFSHINSERLKVQFINPLAIERTGRKNVPITNGILLYGPEDLTKITLNSIKNTVDANFVKIKFNESDPLKSIGDMVDAAKKAEKDFQETRKRTILEFDNLDKMLTNKDNIDGIEMIGRFKGFVEHISKDYHITIIAKTDRPLSDFEPASIASHRFGMKIKVE